MSLWAVQAQRGTCQRCVTQRPDSRRGNLIVLYKYYLFCISDKKDKPFVPVLQCGRLKKSMNIQPTLCLRTGLKNNDTLSTATHTDKNSTALFVSSLPNHGDQENPQWTLRGGMQWECRCQSSLPTTLKGITVSALRPQSRLQEALGGSFAAVSADRPNQANYTRKQGQSHGGGARTLKRASRGTQCHQRYVSAEVCLDALKSLCCH